LLKKNPDLVFAYFIRGFLNKKNNNIRKARRYLTLFIEKFKGDEKWKNIAKKLMEE
jgi:hypothetical protein